MTGAVSRSSSVALWIIAVLATLMFLRTARSLLIPIAMAALISYALAPVVGWLERLRVPKAIGAALVLLAIAAAVGFGLYAVRDDLREGVEQLPEAVRRLREAVSSRLGAAASQSNSGSSGAGGAQQAASGAAALAGHLVVVFFLVYFLLASADHVKQRLVEVAGGDAEGRRKATKVIQDINTHIQRYLLVLLVTAIIVGVATSIALAVMGVRHAVMWGALAGVFNSIPYFGPVIVSGGLFAVGMTQGDVQQAMRMAGVAIAITSLEGWLLTPVLMGKAERMSALAVFLGLLLWTWLWDAWGTILAVPMLVVLKSVADQVESLKPVGRLLAVERKG